MEEVRFSWSDRICTFFRPVSGRIFLFLTACVWIFVLYVMDVMEFQSEAKPPINIAKIFTGPRSLCTLRALSPEEAPEEDFIMDSVAWPDTVPLPYGFSPTTASHPACSHFFTLPRGGREGGGGEIERRVGDQLEIMIQMYDYRCQPKKSGGDVLLARLHSATLGAGVAGRIVDHLNGSYSAVFPLLWTGGADVQVTLVHPSEAVTVLRRLTRRRPDRIYFQSFFRSGAVSERTICNICLRPSPQPLCNYTDVRTGEPWFCYKPRTLSCDSRINQSKGGHVLNIHHKERRLFVSGVNMKVPILSTEASHIVVLPKKEEANRSSESWRPSGYYYQDVWRSLGSTTVRQFNNQSIGYCLQGKVVHMYGDSTIRQWFEYLNEVLPDLREFDLQNQKKVGPFLALDYKNNIMVTYRCHGPPIRFGTVPIAELRFVANELDGIMGGPNIVVVLGIWSHFSTFPIEVYIRRLLSIRSAVVRLLARAPDTLVVIRTANPKALNLYETLTNSDWYSLQRDKALRAVFRGANVKLVDAWDMALAHHLPHNLHPQRPIIENMMNVLLSYICPT